MIESPSSGFLQDSLPLFEREPEQVATVDANGHVEKVVTLHNFFDIERIDRLMAQPLPPEEARSGNDRARGVRINGVCGRCRNNNANQLMIRRPQYISVHTQRRRRRWRGRGKPPAGGSRESR